MTEMNECWTRWKSFFPQACVERCQGFGVRACQTTYGSYWTLQEKVLVLFKHLSQTSNHSGYAHGFVRQLVGFIFPRECEKLGGLGGTISAKFQFFVGTHPPIPWTRNYHIETIQFVNVQIFTRVYWKFNRTTRFRRETDCQEQLTYEDLKFHWNLPHRNWVAQNKLKINLFDCWFGLQICEVWDLFWDLHSTHSTAWLGCQGQSAERACKEQRERRTWVSFIYRPGLSISLV